MLLCLVALLPVLSVLKKRGMRCVDKGVESEMMMSVSVVAMEIWDDKEEDEGVAILTNAPLDFQRCRMSLIVWITEILKNQM